MKPVTIVDIDDKLIMSKGYASLDEAEEQAAKHYGKHWRHIATPYTILTGLGIMHQGSYT